MGVPKQRKTKARRNNRRSHHALTAVAVLACEKCGKDALPHRVCENCGTYKQREVVNVFAKLDKKERKRREKEQAVHEREQAREGGGSPEGGAAPGGGSLEELSKK